MKKIQILILILAGVAVSCKQDKLQVNISKIQVNITIDRFEKDLFSADPSAIKDSIPVWQKRYGSFLQYFSYVVKLGNINDPNFADRLTMFITDHTNYQIYKRTMEVFPNVDAFKANLEVACKHYQYYFPEKPLPQILTYVGGLNQSGITGDSLIAMGLDKYLGSHEPLYREAGIYQYLIVNMHPEKLASDCIAFWGETEFPFYDSISNLAANIIYRGKLLYFTRAMLPDQPDTINWGFSAKNLEYCVANEKAMWTKLIEKKYLFNTERFTIDKFILEGPYTKDFGRESPARAAVWIGYKIVSAYMAKNSDISLPMLMAEKDYMKILNLSSYNP
jgi:hypothetical protein